jgi:hypothetical protein
VAGGYDGQGRPGHPVLKDSRDRGSRRGAKWFIVADRTLYAYRLARDHGIDGIVFRSGKEAKRWLFLLHQQDAGTIRYLRRGKPVAFALQTRNPLGLTVTVCTYIPDAVYEEPSEPDCWRLVVEDTKPSGMMMRHGKRVPFREDTYLLKRQWFEAQYGIKIREV